MVGPFVRRFVVGRFFRHISFSLVRHSSLHLLLINEPAGDLGQINAVKEAFHLSSAPATVACRDLEQTQILDFCKACIQQDAGGSLYICGCPGTGKTLSVCKVEEVLISWSTEASLFSPILYSFFYIYFFILYILAFPESELLC